MTRHGLPFQSKRVQRVHVAQSLIFSVVFCRLSFVIFLFDIVLFVYRIMLNVQQKYLETALTSPNILFNGIYIKAIQHLIICGNLYLP